MAPSSENQKFETDNLIVGRTEPEINENQKFEAENLITGSTEPKFDKQKKFDTVNLLAGRTEAETSGIPLKGRIWTMPGCSFIAASAGTKEQFTNSKTDGTVVNEANVEHVVLGVDLPNGAIIANVVAYGSDTTDIWILKRQLINSSDNGTTMATAVLGTADTSITNATIDNTSYKYWFDVECSTDVYGVKITYAY